MRRSLQDQIEEAALLLFSRQGFNETSTFEIAKAANVSEATIFRMFKTKHDLYINVLDKYGRKADLSYNSIFHRLSFENLESDLKVIVDSFYRFYFDNIHITRIYISNAIQFSEIKGFNYLSFPQLREFLEGYLKEMNIRGKIREELIIRVSDLVMSFMVKDVAFLTTFGKVEVLDEKILSHLEEKWQKRLGLLNLML
jgi:AcrR family transcriptional regulator